MRLSNTWRARIDDFERLLESLIPYAALREKSLRLLKRLGWLGGAGLLLLVAAIAVDVGMLVANYGQRSDLTVERLRLERQAATGGGGAGLPRSEAENFYARFPEQSALPRSLARLSEMAEANGMGIVRADYRAVDQPGTQLVRMTLNLPVQGSYGALHAWLSEMLGAMPEVALESLTLRRVDPTADLIEGELRLALFARRP